MYGKRPRSVTSPADASFRPVASPQNILSPVRLEKLDLDFSGSPLFEPSKGESIGHDAGSRILKAAQKNLSANTIGTKELHDQMVPKGGSDAGGDDDGDNKSTVSSSASSEVIIDPQYHSVVMNSDKLNLYLSQVADKGEAAEVDKMIQGLESRENPKSETEDEEAHQGDGYVSMHDVLKEGPKTSTRAEELLSLHQMLDSGPDSSARTSVADANTEEEDGTEGPANDSGVHVGSQNLGLSGVAPMSGRQSGQPSKEASQLKLMQVWPNGRNPFDEVYNESVASITLAQALTMEEHTTHMGLSPLQPSSHRLRRHKRSASILTDSELDDIMIHTAETCHSIQAAIRIQKSASSGLGLWISKMIKISSSEQASREAKQPEDRKTLAAVDTPLSDQLGSAPIGRDDGDGDGKENPLSTARSSNADSRQSYSSSADSALVALPSRYKKIESELASREPDSQSSASVADLPSRRPVPHEEDEEPQSLQDLKSSQIAPSLLSEELETPAMSRENIDIVDPSPSHPPQLASQPTVLSNRNSLQLWIADSSDDDEGNEQHGAHEQRKGEQDTNDPDSLL
ncbi:hypothetical protein GGI12_004331 [Dipsacomyces acuminosporus]|nr:hypothetical protein GGI12_004331 [Dipsacomyces acuminosporus]